MADPVKEIEAFIHSKPIAIYMKGTLDFPMCGFSARAVQALEAAGAKRDQMTSFNVLEDRQLFEALKQYSQWPTSPQVYINGEFIGGSDIVMEMLESGELQEKLKSIH